jgi:hypothetical protein
MNNGPYKLRFKQRQDNEIDDKSDAEDAMNNGPLRGSTGATG